MSITDAPLPTSCFEGLHVQCYTGLSKLELYMQVMMRQALRHRNKTQQTGALRAQPP